MTVEEKAAVIIMLALRAFGFSELKPTVCQYHYRGRPYLRRRFCYGRRMVSIGRRYVCFYTGDKRHRGIFGTAQRFKTTEIDRIIECLV